MMVVRKWCVWRVSLPGSSSSREGGGIFLAQCVFSTPVSLCTQQLVALFGGAWFCLFGSWLRGEMPWRWADGSSGWGGVVYFGFPTSRNLPTTPTRVRYAFSPRPSLHVCLPMLSKTCRFCCPLPTCYAFLEPVQMLCRREESPR
jgi:hypothetical protein